MGSGRVSRDGGAGGGRRSAGLPGGADPRRTCWRSLSPAASPRRARNQRWLGSGRGVFRPCPGCEAGETLDLEAWEQEVLSCEQSSSTNRCSGAPRRWRRPSPGGWPIAQRSRWCRSLRPMRTSSTARISWWWAVPPTPTGCPGRVLGRGPGSWRGSRGTSLSWYRALSAAREYANGSHRSAGGGRRRRFRYPAPGTAGVHRSSVEVHPPAPRPARGAHRCVTRELPRRGHDRGLGRGRTGAGPRLGRAPERSDCLRGAAGAPPGLLTPFAVKSATVREHRGAVS